MSQCISLHKSGTVQKFSQCFSLCRSCTQCIRLQIWTSQAVSSALVCIDLEQLRSLAIVLQSLQILYTVHQTVQIWNSQEVPQCFSLCRSGTARKFRHSALQILCTVHQTVQIWNSQEVSQCLSLIRSGTAKKFSHSALVSVDPVHSALDCIDLEQLGRVMELQSVQIWNNYKFSHSALVYVNLQQLRSLVIVLQSVQIWCMRLSRSGTTSVIVLQSVQIWNC